MAPSMPFNRGGRGRGCGRGRSSVSRAASRAAAADIDAFLAAPPPNREATAAAVLHPNHHPRTITTFITNPEIEANPQLALENAGMTTFGMEVRETFDALANQANFDGGQADTSTTAAIPPPAAAAAGANSIALTAGTHTNDSQRRSSPRRPARLPERFRPTDDDETFHSAASDTDADAAFLLDNGAPADAEEMAEEDTEAAAAAAAGLAFELPSVTVQEMQAGIISKNTRDGYATYMKQFLVYCRDNEPT